jgi:hypothetical protein
LSINNYLQYFQKHPSYLDICYLLRLNSNHGLTASQASKELGLAIQTVSNSLKGLEREKIIYSKKLGRQRIYYPKDSNSFSKALDESFRLLEGTRRLKGRHFPFQVLSTELAHELRILASKDPERLTVHEDIRISGRLADVRCQFQISRATPMPINTIIIAQIVDEDSILSLLGKAFLVAKAQVKGTLTFVLLLTPDIPAYGRYQVTLPEAIRSISDAFSSDKKGTSKTQVSILQHFADETTMLVPDYPKRLAADIWRMRHGPQE